MTTSIQRPNVTLLSSGITLFGGAGSLHATLADNSDTTYAALAASGQGQVNFAALTVPTGAILQSVVLRARCRRAAAGSILYAQLNNQPTIPFHPPTGSGWSTLASVSQNGITKGALAGGVHLFFIAQPGSADLAEVYLDVTYSPLPTLNVTAPTGTIGVSQPTATWDYTGDYPQERFRIKLFSSAQYSAAGFNPETSGALFDTGEQLGSGHSFVPTFNLSNGGTYRFYVKVAQRVGSTTQWSAWDFTQPTVAVTPPAVPTLTVTAESADARIKIVATNSGTPTWEFLTIEKTMDGTNWIPVRSATRAPISGTSVTVYDYESGNSELTQYRALSVVADPGGDIASDWSATTAAVMWSATAAWLKSLTRPTLNHPVVIQDIPTITRRIPRNVLDIAGRADPVVVSDTRRLVEGTVTFVTLEGADLDVLQALLDTSETLLLQTPQSWGFGSRYISCGDEEEQRTGPSALEASRLVVVPFNEVTAPVGEVVTFGITYDDVLAAFATYTAVAAAFPTYTAVLSANL